MAIKALKTLAAKVAAYVSSGAVCKSSRTQMRALKLFLGRLLELKTKLMSF